MDVVIVNDTSVDAHYGCDAVMAAIEAACRDAGFTVTYRHPVGVDWRQSEPARQAIAGAGLVLVNGEGTLHHDNRRAIALAALGPFCRERSVPSALINASIYALDEALPSLAAFDAIFTRDEASRLALAAAGIDAQSNADLSFTHDLSSARSAGPRGFSFTDSVNRATTRRLLRTARSLEAPYLPMRKSAEPESFEGFARALGTCELVVTGRFHVACFCLNIGVPFVAVPSNTNKIEALLDEALGSTRRMMGEGSLMPDGRIASWIAQYGGRATSIRHALLPFAAFSHEEEERRLAYVRRARASLGQMWRQIAAKPR